MRRFVRHMPLVSTLALASGLLAGCGGDSNQPAAKTAQEAIGVPPESEKTITKTREVNVIEDTKVVDRQTGKILEEKKEVKPVTIEEKTTVTRDVDVQVGEPSSSNK